MMVRLHNMQPFFVTEYGLYLEFMRMSLAAPML